MSFLFFHLNFSGFDAKLFNIRGFVPSRRISARLIENRYISANTHGNRPSKNEICNEMDEMYRQDCTNTSCRALLCISLRALGRASMRMLGRVRLFLNAIKHAGFRSNRCGIGCLYNTKKCLGIDPFGDADRRINFLLHSFSVSRKQASSCYPTRSF